MLQHTVFTFTTLPLIIMESQHSCLINSRRYVWAKISMLTSSRTWTVGLSITGSVTVCFTLAINSASSFWCFWCSSKSKINSDLSSFSMSGSVSFVLIRSSTLHGQGYHTYVDMYILDLTLSLSFWISLLRESWISTYFLSSSLLASSITLSSQVFSLSLDPSSSLYF